MKFITTLFLGAGLLFSSCEKKEQVIQNVNGTMKISDSGACTVLIQLSSGPSLFPTNPDKVKPFLTDGKQVTLSYRFDKDFVSPCSGSEPAFIESIR